MLHLSVRCVISLFFLEKQSEIRNAFTFFEKWKVKKIILSLFLRNEKWNDFLFHSFREVKVKLRYLEIEIEKWNFKKNLENSRETRLSLVTDSWCCCSQNSKALTQNPSDNDMTGSEINHSFLFHGVIKILTACGMLRISIARCQIEAEIHSFPTMYIMGGGRYVRNGSNQWFCPKNRPQIMFFYWHISGSSNFGGVWDPKILKCRHFC